MAIIDKPDLHFNTVLYTGNATTNAITGVGFQPDLIWVKSRSGASNSNLIDSVRGVKKHVSSSSTNAEDTEGGSNGLSSFDSDGFTWSGVNTGTGTVNASSTTYVGWSWLGGGTAVSNTDGSITSSVSANTDSGFSVVTYTGVTGNYTVGHGLTGMTPKMVIVKSRDNARNWVAYHHAMGANNWIYPNLTLQQSTDVNYWNNSHPTSSVFSISNTNYPENNANGEDYVAYCFANTSMIKCGSYTGNGSTDGTFVYTGFKPAFVLGKRTNSTEDWFLFDNTRDSYNVNYKLLYPNGSNAEYTGVSARNDFLSNGFKMRITDLKENGSGSTYIYLAIAEQPFVTSTTNGSIPATAR